MHSTDKRTMDVQIIPLGPKLERLSMSKNTWFISDTHFGHANILTFKDYDGNPVRSFSSQEEMDEHMVACWNSVVGEFDRVYHLGDVVINKKFLPILERLKGKKVLVMGNHDIFGHKEYLKYFEDIRAYKIFPKHGIVCSHIPVHVDNLYRWKLNVHGHLHTNKIKGRVEAFDVNQDPWDDPKYLNVCVEQINYTPINLEEILKKIPLWL
jgi:calcineurin-like phosphoesterase family protein